jgi:DNA-binding LacI/PurR family transcriptional regulator
MTMIELAKKAGVSQATVSRVINGTGGVSLETVRQAISETGYRPAPRGKGSAPASSWQVLALIFLDDSYLAHPALALSKIRGVQQAATEAGMSLLIVELLEGAALPPLVTSGRVDGLLLWGGKMSDGVSLPEGVPAMWLSSHHEESGDGVLQGNEAVGRIAAKYLLGQGHRQMAFFNLQGTHPGYRARGEGFEYFVHQGGGLVQRVQEAPSDPAGMQAWTVHTEERVASLVERFLKLKPRPTAIFIPDDQLTALAWRAFLVRGVQPEKDVRIISCNNDQSFLLGLHPRPATVDLAPETTGRRAVEQLLWRIRHPGETRRVQVLVEPMLVRGDAK